MNAILDINRLNEDSKNENPSKEDSNYDTARRTSRLNRLKFKQFMREKNEEDEELLMQFRKHIKSPEGWKIEERFEDLFPSVWLRNENKVIQVYARLGSLVAMLGKLDKKDYQAIYGEDKKDQSRKDDYVILSPLLPPSELPHLVENEETGEEEEDFDNAYEKLSEYVKDSILFLKNRKEQKKIDKRNKEKESHYSTYPNAGDNSDEDRIKGTNVPPYHSTNIPYDSVQSF